VTDADSITDMSFVDGKLVVAGLSNEEFASKLRTIAYPFTTVDPGIVCQTTRLFGTPCLFDENKKRALRPQRPQR
jgi:hypothetical protein